MKRYIACLLAVVFLAGGACAEGTEKSFSFNGTKEAQELRADLQSRYLVTILIGDECLDVRAKGFKVNVSQDALGFYPAPLSQNARYEELVRNLEKALSVYSPFFFYLFYPKNAYQQGGISFMLVNSITYKGCSEVGHFSPDGNWMRIWLAAGDYEEWAVHHEIWHAMEARIRREAPRAFNDWNRLNPEGFSYSGDTALMEGAKAHREPEDWFARDYGKYNAKEDRATVYEAIVTKDDEWWNSRPHLRKKKEYLLEKIRSYFAYWPFAEE